MRTEQAHRFIEWLSYQPTGNEICRALVNEYLLELAPYSARISRLNNDDSLTFVGEYGYELTEAEFNKTVTSSDWRNRTNVAAILAQGAHEGGWAPDGKLVVFALRDRGATQGFLTLRFRDEFPTDKQANLYDSMALFTLPLSLYLSFQNQLQNKGVPKVGAAFDYQNNNASSSVALSQRQLQILRGMVEGKTNHDLALELGYSVSTIRHETMSIYRTLAVSDRHEAARISLAKGLIA